MGKSRRNAEVASFLALAAILIAGCSTKPSSPDVVATSDLGEIKQSELDDFILTLPAGQRRPGDEQDLLEWRRKKLEQLIFTRYLEREASLADDPLEEQERLAAQIDTLVEGEVEARRVREHVEITDADLRRFYDENPDEFRRGEQIRLRNIFLRVDRNAPAAERQAVRDEADRLHRELQDGANFEELAKTHSESETAPLGGLIGRVDRGSFSPQMETTIWAVEEGGITDVLETPVGFHIFRVDNHLAAEERELDEVRGIVTRRLTNEATEATLAAYFDELLDASAATYNPDGLDDDDTATVLFELDDERLTLGDWHNRLGKLPFHVPRATSEPDQLREWVRKQLYAWEARRSGLTDEPAIAEQIANLRHRTNVSLAYRTMRDQAIAALPESDLLAYYDQHRRRFQAPRLIHLRLLTQHVETEGQGLFRVFEQLDRTADAIRAGDISFAEAAQRWSDDLSAGDGGDVGTIRLESFGEWAGPAAQKEITKLQPGDVGGPYMIERYDERNLTYSRMGYMLVEMVEIKEPEIRPFEEVRDQVRDQLAQDQAAEISDRIAANALVAINARVHTENL